MNELENGTFLGALFAGLEPKYVDCFPETVVGMPVDDSRDVRSGSVFVAVRGETHDGHVFLGNARAGGAKVLVHEPGHEVEGPRVELSDTRSALPRLAANAYEWPAKKMALAGVTGTNGKTTTTHLVASMLAASGRTHVRLGTTGNWLGDELRAARFTTPFPLELQRLLAVGRDAGATHGVMEVSSHALAQGRAQPLEYQAVALTSFSQDHLDFHEDMDDYLRQKCRLASEHLAAGGLALAPKSAGPAAQRFLEAARARGARAWTVGFDAGVDLRAVDVELGAQGVRARVVAYEGEAKLTSPLVGNFNVENLLVAVGLGLGLGLDLEEACANLAEATGAPGRLERVEIVDSKGPAVYVDYAHTPDAVARAIEALRGICAGDLVVLLGCGGDRDTSKRPLMGRAASEGADLFVATSDNPRTENPEAIIDQMLTGVAPGARVERQVDRGRAIAESIASARPTDTILIAGKGHEDYQILGTEKIDFCDREHARAALRARRA